LELAETQSRAPEAPGNDFAERAEELRRAGEADAALRLARQGLIRHPERLEGHVAAALALLDLHHPDEARRVLERALEAGGAPAAPVPPELSRFDALGDSELDSALESASAEREAMIDADGIAFEAMRAARLDEPESVRAGATSLQFADAADEDAAPDGAAGFATTPDSPFHTRTMADLLERQGAPEAAQAIRSTLDRHSRDGDTEQRRAAVVHTLERWLARLRGGDA